jgi:HAMP domain-containing protein
MDATQFKLAYEADQITQMQAWGLVASIRGAAGQPLNDATRAEIENTGTRMRQYWREGADNLQYALDYNPALDAALAGNMTVTKTAIDTAIQLAEKEILGAQAAPTIKPAQWMATTDAALTANLGLFDSCLANLDQLLGDRIGRLQSDRMFALATVAVAVLLTLVFMYFVSRSITRPIASLRAAAEKVSLGSLDTQIDTSGRDEISALASAFQRMQKSMKIAAQAGGDDL